MTPCDGYGDCIQLCCCGCYDDDDCTRPSLDCHCGHRAHSGTHSDQYCKVNCPYNCKLVKCRNYTRCGQLRPEWLLRCYDYHCLDCDIANPRKHISVLSMPLNASKIVFKN